MGTLNDQAVLKQRKGRTDPMDNVQMARGVPVLGVWNGAEVCCKAEGEDDQ